jgi:hypothetical protein
MNRSKALPPRTLAEVLEHVPQHRQSLLAEFNTCALRTRWRLEAAEAIPLSERHDRAWDRADAARGILAHRYSAEVLRTLWRTGETSIDVSQALEVLYEVCAQRDVPDRDVVYLPARERRLLRMYAVRFVQHGGSGDPHAGKLRKWNMARLMPDGIEERLWAKVAYPNPDGGSVERLITGQPDARLYDGADGRVVLDWKTTPKAPPAPPDRKYDDAGDVYGDDVPGNVSDEGYYQQRVYAFLEWANDAALERVTLREVYPLDPDGLQVRRATLYRSRDFERIARELSVDVELLDRAIAGGSRSPRWKPQPGKHCLRACPRPGSCPIPREERREGAIEGPQQAEEWAAQMLTAKAVYEHRRDGCKAYHEQTGHSIPVATAKGVYELRHEEGTRSFGLHALRERVPDDENLTATFRAAAERRRNAA